METGGVIFRSLVKWSINGFQGKIKIRNWGRRLLCVTGGKGNEEVSPSSQVWSQGMLWAGMVFRKDRQNRCLLCALLQHSLSLLFGIFFLSQSQHHAWQGPWPGVLELPYLSLPTWVGVGCHLVSVTFKKAWSLRISISKKVKLFFLISDRLEEKKNLMSLWQECLKMFQSTKGT